MKNTIAVIVLLFFSGSVYAWCKPDATNTTKTVHDDLKWKNFIHCATCRDVNKYPGDAAFRMWNWAVANADGTDNAGYSIFVTTMMSTVQVYQLDTNKLSMPVCTRKGQCVTVQIEVTFYGVTVGPIINGYYISWNTGVKDVRLHVLRHTKPTYSITRTKAEALARTVLPVPTSTAADTIKAGECKNNRDQLREEETTLTENTNPGSANPDYETQHDWWRDEEEAYGGRVPSHRCGTSTLSTGESTTTCGWYWY